MTVFAILAGLMLLAALAFALLPLLRQGGRLPRRAALRRQALDDALAAGVLTPQEHAAKAALLDAESAPNEAAPPRSRTAFTAAVTLLFLLPASAIAMYGYLGNLRAMDSAVMALSGADGTPGPDMAQAVQGLADKLAQNPDDVEGWMLLGRAYKSMERFAEARDALENAYKRAADNVDVQVDYAESLALAGENRRIEGRARELLEAAVKTDPAHQRGLWLLGIASYQQGDYAAAAGRWEHLRSLMPPGSDAIGSLDRQIADARQRAGGADATPAPAAPSGNAPAAAAAAAAAPPAAAPAAPVAASAAAAPPAPAAPAAADVRLAVEVSLDPALRERAPAGASLFVFARAAAGPPMPLAVQRLTVADLPAKVTLTEEMGMMPSMKLSQFEQVVVVARISPSGNAKAQSGDLQAVSAALDVKTRTPIKLVINEVVP